MTYYGASFDRLTFGYYHLQVITPITTTKRMTHKMFTTWVRHLNNLGYKMTLEYDSKHHTYFAIAKEVA